MKIERTKPHVNVGIIGYSGVHKSALTAAIMMLLSGKSRPDAVILVPKDISRADLERVIGELGEAKILQASHQPSIDHRLEELDSAAALADLAQFAKAMREPRPIIGQPYPPGKKHIPIKIGPSKQFALRVCHPKNF